MKITIIGGGPGGLYCALLTKKRMPAADITVYEQNQPGDTFGFGVVFSDETLDEFLSADPASYDLIRDHFAYWGDIIIDRGDQQITIGGNGFAGCSRKKLLEILQTRCEQVGVILKFGAKVDAQSLDTQFPNSDLIIVTDGVNSQIRQKYATEFGATITNQSNKFTWLGSTKPLDGFTFFFEQTEHGPFCAHTYQYEDGHSTWVIETTNECWAAHGFDHMSEDESARCLEQIFAKQLDGHTLMTNRSIWRNFPKVTCDNWRVGNMILLGDAKATAHWSIGSGTKLAMECAIALSDAITENPGDIDAIANAYETTRRTPVEITQHNAQVSLKWFEDMAMHLSKAPYEFAFSLMSRAKALTWDNLELRDEQFIEHVEREFYARYKSETGRDLSDQRPTPMFTPYDLREITLPNRVVMAPMAQYSAVDGRITDWHKTHYAARAHGGVGLVIIEMTSPSPTGRITPKCTGLWNDEQMNDWRELISFMRETSPSKYCLQLGHSGRKGATQSPMAITANGKMDLPLSSDDEWLLLSASALPYLDGTSQTPKAMDRADMDRIRDEFVAATIRADKAGFDMIELHCAHGYLLASFLSPLTNQRTDDYGGSAENRVRYPAEVFSAMRAVWPDHKPMSVRISACDWMAGGITLDDVTIISKAFKHAGADIIHASSGQTVPGQKPIYGRMWQTPFAEHIKHTANIPTIAVGDITQPEQINMIVAASRADLCALARPHLNNPYFTRQAAGHYGVRSSGNQPMGWPNQLSSGEYQLYREAEKAREKTHTLALKARPKERHG